MQIMQSSLSVSSESYSKEQERFDYKRESGFMAGGGMYEGMFLLQSEETGEVRRDNAQHAFSKLYQEVVQSTLQTLVNHRIASSDRRQTAYAEQKRSGAIFSVMDSETLQLQPVDIVTVKGTRLRMQSLKFPAGGVVKTADGREIAIDINLSLSESLVQKIDLRSLS